MLQILYTKILYFTNKSFAIKHSLTSHVLYRYLEDQQAYHVAIGNMDINTMQKIDDFVPERTKVTKHVEIFSVMHCFQDMNKAGSI